MRLAKSSDLANGSNADEPLLRWNEGGHVRSPDNVLKNELAR